ncbi:unnamed protein product [Pleuronectes platessa]|uniref:Uncharacterized protein n=1 Tax=Pleuronectes platessa TaxID=8262 RepID=A0A9N7V8G7_PLEPL|nr:unnamed protein product [Pleuronectes platessa]
MSGALMRKLLRGRGGEEERRRGGEEERRRGGSGRAVDGACHFGCGSIPVILVDWSPAFIRGGVCSKSATALQTAPLCLLPLKLTDTNTHTHITHIAHKCQRSPRSEEAEQGRSDPAALSTSPRPPEQSVRHRVGASEPRLSSCGRAADPRPGSARLSPAQLGTVQRRSARVHRPTREYMLHHYPPTTTPPLPSSSLPPPKPERVASVRAAPDQRGTRSENTA